MSQRDTKLKLTELEDEIGAIKKLLEDESINKADSRRAPWKPAGPAAIALALGVFILSAVILHAAPIIKPNDFTSGTVISSSEVNANFDAIYAVSHPRTFIGAHGGIGGGGIIFVVAGFASPTEHFFPMPDSGTIRSFRLYVSVNSFNGAVIYTVRLNGVDTAVTLTVPAATTGVFADLTNTVDFNAGDRLSIKRDATAVGAGAMAGAGYSFQY